MYILIPDLKDCRFSCEEMQKCFIEITNPPPPTISSGWGMDRKHSNIQHKKYILPLLREKEACYGNQTCKAYSGSEGEGLCHFFFFFFLLPERFPLW